MSALKLIRSQVLGLNQRELAELTGVSQATVSRWETGELAPSMTEMGVIRDEARKKGKKFNEAWFFDDAKAAREIKQREVAQ